ncbi:MAG: TM0106 family RecB-like putative nuclease [Candidatus Eisenbacteria bacterium]|uniref:TM0106 family RecB-like putative nuclease n=1 Tax=Eiseniibacteriota bacterium TaxID=2212470 RepID=A0A849SJL1_UNCEI|nr:TM0106 family RecB-like putative nuclease [Candidatus Eisenbacteria bacterium]
MDDDRRSNAEGIAGRKQRLSDMQHRITASLLYNLVLCPHRVERDMFSDPIEKDPPNAFVELLWERGSAFESSVVEALRPEPLNLRAGNDEARVRATLTAMREGVPLIIGGRLESDDLLGEPDLLRREGDRYIAGDIKSGRGLEGGDEGDGGRLKLHYAVQLGLYTDLLERLGWSVARRAFVWDVESREVSYDFELQQSPKTPGTWWDAYQSHLELARGIANGVEKTTPALCGDCKMCHWMSACSRKAEEVGDLSLIPEVGRSRRDRLGRRFPNIRAFAAADLTAIAAAESEVLKGIGVGQALRWQARARLQLDPAAHPYSVTELELPFGETILYFDVETDPMLDFCYLHGFWVVDVAGKRFVEFHAADATRAEERSAFASAVDFVRSLPTAPIVHYAPYERVTWRGLGERYPDVATADEAQALLSTPRAFDLYHGAIRPHTIWPTRDYSIKSVAKHLGFSWRDRHPSGAASIEWFQAWLKSGDPAELQRILDYNEDDCRAMEVVLDALRKLPVKTH